VQQKYNNNINIKNVFTMKATIQEQEGRTLAILEGRLDTAASSQAQKDLEPLKNSNGIDIVLDCTNLEYIASSGLRIFLSLLQATKPKGCQVIIRGANDYLREVFSMTGFSRLFIIE
jgi:anti-sigma B factor antagonist